MTLPGTSPSAMVRLFAETWSLSWQATLLVVMVMAAQMLTRKWLSPSWRYRLWLLVVVRLLLPFSPASPLSIFNVVRRDVPLVLVPSVQPVTSPGSVSTVTTSGSAIAPAIAPGVSTPTAIQAPSAANTTMRRPNQAVQGTTAPAPVPRLRHPLAPPAPPLNWLSVAAWAWLVGASMFAVGVGWTAWRFLRQVRHAVPVDDPQVILLLDHCRRQMRIRHPVALRETVLVKSPALYGVRHPRLLLPPGLTRRFSPPELRYVFLHELAHVKRRDVAMNWLLTLLQVVHWFNPLLWFSFARMRADRELACDALVISCTGETEAKTYGLTIIKLLEEFARPTAAPGLIGILENGRQMKRRIRLIASFRPGGRWSWLAAGLMAALAVIGLTDAVRSSHAQAPKPAADPLRLTVLDAQTGQPIADAKVITGYSRNVSFPGGAPPLLHTGADGVLIIPEGGQWGGLGLGVFAANYAPKGVCENWFSSQPEPKIPPVYTVKLERGTAIGGTLRDEAGQPLANVRVVARGICDPRKSGEKPPVIEEYPFYDPTFNPGAVTDAAGRWSIPNFPTGIEVLALDFQRPDGALARFHTPLARWKYSAMSGDLIDLETARRGELVCVFKRGIDVRGVVLDAVGQPLAGVKITETDGRHGLQPITTLETGTDGRFVLPGRDPHQLLLTLTAPGMAIQPQVVTVEPGLPELTLTMHSAAGLRLRVVDTEGHLVVGAHLAPAERTLSWTGQTGADGRVAWDLAPVESMAYNLEAKDYGPRVLQLAATGAEQTITLRRGDPYGTLLHIKAADETGHPLEAFTVSVARRTSGGRVDDFDAPQSIAEGHAGDCFVVASTEKTNGGEFRVRIESAGLEPYLSEPLSGRPGDLDLAVVLHHAGDARTTLRLPGGQPAAGAAVVVKDPASSDDASFELLFFGQGKPRVEREHKKTVVADNAGTVALPPGAADTLAIIVHDSGYLFTTLGELHQRAETTLAAWGHLEGTLTINNHPQGDQRLSLHPAGTTFPKEVYLQYILSTDHVGHFNFERVPAGNYTLFCTKPSSGTWPQNHPAAIEIKAGETTRIAYGGGGRTVIGKVHPVPEDANIDWKNDVGDCLLSRQYPPGRDGTADDDPAYDDYVRAEDYERASKLNLSGHGYVGGGRDTYEPEFDTDGSFRAVGLPPGTYEFRVQLRQSHVVNHQWQEPTLLGKLQRTVIVPEADAASPDAPVDLGSMDVIVDASKLPPRPTVALAARTLDNHQEVSLANYRGKHVLIMFWASWAPIPAEEVAAWKRLANAHHGDDNFVLLGVSLDDDPDAARRFVQTQELPGTQTRLEGQAKTVVTEALSIDALPATLLVDPDGHVAARDLSSPLLRATPPAPQFPPP